MLGEVAANFVGVVADSFGTFAAVGDAGGIAKVEDGCAGEGAADGAGDGESADARIEDTDGKHGGERSGEWGA